MGKMHCFRHILCFGPIPIPLPKQLSLLFLPLTSVFSTSFPWRYTIFLICIKNAPNISLPLKALPDHYVLLNHSLLSSPLKTNHRQCISYTHLHFLTIKATSILYPDSHCSLWAQLYPLKSLLHTVARVIFRNLSLTCSTALS